jgi:hypothetical protein
MKDSIKLLYSGIYILFLLTAFTLFAVIKNTPGGTVLSYLSIFIILVLGSLLYFLAVNKPSSDGISTKSNNQEPADKQQDIPGPVEVNVMEEEAQIDIQKLMPPRTLGIEKYGEELLRNMADSFNMVQGLFYMKDPVEDLFHCNAQYAYFSENKPVEFRPGETLPGQAVKNKTIVSINNIPDQYTTIASGLGKSNPKQLVFVPLKNQDDVVGLIEYATFEALSEKQMKALEGISKKVADTIIKHLKK